VYILQQEMTSSLPSIGVHSLSSPPKSGSFQSTMTSSLPVMATSGSWTAVRQRPPRRRRSGPNPDGRHPGGVGGSDGADCLGSGRGDLVVDVPRRIMAENTFVASDTHVALHLERFYNSVASVNADQLAIAKDR